MSPHFHHHPSSVIRCSAYVGALRNISNFSVSGGFRQSSKERFNGSMVTHARDKLGRANANPLGIKSLGSGHDPNHLSILAGSAEPRPGSLTFAPKTHAPRVMHASVSGGRSPFVGSDLVMQNTPPDIEVRCYWSAVRQRHVSCLPRPARQSTAQ